MPWTHSIAKALAACGITVLAVLTVPGTASAAPQAVPKPASHTRVTFGIEPASATKPDDRPDYTFGATPGAALLDHVAVVNYSSVPLILQVYATDALTTTSGSFGLPPATATPKGVGTWIALPARVVTVRVPAKSSKAPGFTIVPFRLSIPLAATPGDNAGGIVASLQTRGRNATGQDVILNQRIGTRVFVRIAGALTPSLQVSDFRATYHGTLNPFGRGSIVATFRVRNTGNVSVGFTPVLSSSGALGASNQRRGSTIALILPGSTVQDSVTVTRVWPQFVASLKLRIQSFGEAGNVDPTLVKADATVSGSTATIPWPMLVLIVLVVGEIARRRIVRHRRSPISRAPHVRQHGRQRVKV